MQITKKEKEKKKKKKKSDTRDTLFPTTKFTLYLCINSWFDFSLFQILVVNSCESVEIQLEVDI